MTRARAVRTVGWIGLGDQGAPMAQAVAQSNFELHVWARRAQSLTVLESLPHTVHDNPADLAKASDMLAMCLREDADIEQVIAANSLWANIRPGSILVNHGTGLPQFAKALAAQATLHQSFALDAPVSGGRPGAVARRLTTIVGGDAAVADQATRVFEGFSSDVVYVGESGTGQMVKLINNALLMLNQLNVQRILRLADDLELNLAVLVDVLRSGSGSSFALKALQGAITRENAEHLKQLQLIDMDLFRDAMVSAGIEFGALFNAAVEGANGLPGAARLVALP